MAISKQTQQILDAYAAQEGGKQAPEYTTVTDIIASYKKDCICLNHTNCYY